MHGLWSHPVQIHYLLGISRFVRHTRRVNTPPGTGCGDNPRTFLDTGSDNLRYAWWQQVVAGSDQLQQRVALALSEIFVVPDLLPGLATSRYGVAANVGSLFSPLTFAQYQSNAANALIPPAPMPRESATFGI